MRNFHIDFDVTISKLASRMLVNCTDHDAMLMWANVCKIFFKFYRALKQIKSAQIKVGVSHELIFSLLVVFLWS